MIDTIYVLIVILILLQFFLLRFGSVCTFSFLNIFCSFFVPATVIGGVSFISEFERSGNAINATVVACVASLAIILLMTLICIFNARKKPNFVHIDMLEGIPYFSYDYHCHSELSGSISRDENGSAYFADANDEFPLFKIAVEDSVVNGEYQIAPTGKGKEFKIYSPLYKTVGIGKLADD